MNLFSITKFKTRIICETEPYRCNRIKFEYILQCMISFLFGRYEQFLHLGGREEDTRIPHPT